MKYYRIRLENKVSTSIFDEGLVGLRMAQLKNIFGESALVDKVECDENGNLLSLSQDTKDAKNDVIKSVDVATQIVDHFIEHEVKHQS